MTSSSGRHDYAKSLRTTAVVKPQTLESKPGFHLIFAALSIKLDSALNLPFSEWTMVFPNPRLCKALLDRITDRAHIIETGTESFRFRRTVERRKKA
jgi:hypothetical protein